MAQKTGHRVRTDYSIPKGYRMHKDALAAIKETRKECPSYPPAVQISLAVIFFRDEIKRRGVKKTDDLEAKMGLLI